MDDTMGPQRSGNTAISILCFLLFTGFSCHRKADDDGSARERLHNTCEAWCQVAVPCSMHFAGPEWGDFSTQTECEDVCTANIEIRAEKSDECFDIILDVRECAAALTCEEFKKYEVWAFSDPIAFPVSCIEEQQLELERCNF